MKEIINLICKGIGTLIMLEFILGFIWFLFFAMILGNFIATFLIIVFIILLFINIKLYIKKEEEKT